MLNQRRALSLGHAVCPQQFVSFKGNQELLVLVDVAKTQHTRDDEEPA